MGEDREESARRGVNKGPASLRARIILWAPVILLLAFEFFLSSQSKLPQPPIRLPGMDKIVHAGYFFLVSFFSVRAARYGEGWSRKKTAKTLLVAALAWGVLDEFHQSFVPGRAVEVADIVADVLGVALALLAAEPFWKALSRVKAPVEEELAGGQGFEPR